MLPTIFTIVYTTLLYGVVLLASLWCWFRWNHRELIREANKVPYLYHALPFIGHAHYTLFGIEKVTRWAVDMSIEAMTAGLYTICFWCGPIPLVMVHGLKDIQKILNSSITTEKGDEINYAKYALGEGLLTAPGDVWKMTRRHINPLFHPQNVEQLIPEFNRNSRELVTNLSEHVGGAPVDIIKYTMDISLKTICQLIFGADIEFDITSEGFRGLMTVVKRFPDLLTRRVLRVWLRIDFVFEFMYKKELRELNKLWRNFTETPLKITKNNNEVKWLQNKFTVESDISENHDSVRTGPLNLLNVYSVLQKNFPQFSDEDLKSEMITLYCTGTDTVGLATAYCLLILAQYRDIQERLYEEILCVVSSEDDINVQDLHRMPYLDQVYKETLRWSTIVPYIIRKPSEDIKLSASTIPAGNTIIVCLLGLHMDPKHYPEPLKFDPERFSPNNMAGKERYAFLPYSGGPRNCIGKTYAQYLMKIMVIHVLRRYKLSTDMDINKMERKLEITLISAQGYKISLESR